MNILLVSKNLFKIAKDLFKDNSDILVTSSLVNIDISKVENFYFLGNNFWEIKDILNIFSKIILIKPTFDMNEINKLPEFEGKILILDYPIKNYYKSFYYDFYKSLDAKEKMLKACSNETEIKESIKFYFNNNNYIDQFKNMCCKKKRTKKDGTKYY